MRSSRFVSLTDYCVVEYMAEELSGPDFYTDQFILIKNDYLDTYQIVNQDSSYATTKNIKDLTMVPLSGNAQVYIDSEKIPPYLSYDTNFTETTLGAYNVLMDQVRFHFVAGFDFDTFTALILSIKNTMNDGRDLLFANILLAPETSAELITFNTKPIFLGNATYDRYIDIFIPSIKNINDEYNIAPVPSATFVAAITPTDVGSTGFITNAPISIGVSECNKRTPVYTTIGQVYDSFEISEHFEATVSQSNEFDNVGATIGEAIDGDYVEFYLTFNGNFPSDLISILNNRNPANDWIIIHQLSIFEQVGTSFLNTSRFVFFQEDRFDEPNLFRPVLKNANIAVSMSIDYLVRLTNRTTGEQIIREASFSLISPKKYGKKLISLSLLDKPQSQIIYNKLIKKSFEASKLFIDQKLNPDDTDFTEDSVNTIVRTEYVPIFFSNNNICISNTSALIKISDSIEEIVFGPGKLRFIISPFDNELRLKVYTLNSSSNSYSLIPLDLNINAAKYNLVFDTSGGKISVSNENNSSIENLSTGQVAFNISKKNSEIILQSLTRTVYLISVSQNSKETLIYSGEWRKTTEQADVDLAISEARAEAEAKTRANQLLTEISNKITDKTHKELSEPISKTGSIKNIAISPIVNKFGTKGAKSLMPTTRSISKK